MKDGICKLDALMGVPDDFEIHDGVSRLAGWPPDASAAMDPNFPKDIGLADSLNLAGFVVISARAREFLNDKGVGKPEKIEFLPIKIINHKGRLEAAEYFIVNPLDVIDCVDREASETKAEVLDKKMIRACERLVLRENVIPADLKIFRLGFWSGRIILRRELADSMKAAGLTMMKFFEPEDYEGF
jgi:hypothetical protein